MKELTKEELIKLSEPSWQKINSELTNGVNPFPYQFGFIDGYRLSDQNTKPLIDEIAELKKQLQQQVECTEHIKEICDEYEMQNNKLQSDLKAAESVNEQNQNNPCHNQKIK